jgi:hypothetical protein
MCVLVRKGHELIDIIKKVLPYYGTECSSKNIHSVMNAISNDSFLGDRFMHFPETVLDEIAKYAHSDNVFIPCTPLELSSWCEDDKIFVSHPRMVHSIRMIEKNHINHVFGINMINCESIIKIGPIRIIHGKLNNFCGLIKGVICSSDMQHHAADIRKKYGLSWSVDTFIPVKKTSSHMEEIKSARSWPPVSGSKVRARPSNGMPGGNIGIVEKVDLNHIVVNFDGKRMKYKIDDPRTSYLLDLDLT